jgi:hypothetical protein
MVICFECMSLDPDAPMKVSSTSLDTLETMKKSTISVIASAKALAMKTWVDGSARSKMKSLIAINAAALVLEKAGKPMTCGQMIDAMPAQRLWESTDGKTPKATLYSGILREMANKGREAWFKKVARGQFAHS